MTRTWVIADPHFGHQGVCNFLREDGTKLRPWDHSEDMDEALVKNWNERVQDQDRIYVLGDVVMRRRDRHILYRLKGRKVLVKGNHDIFKLEDYLPFFDDIRACVVGGKGEGRYILTHIPIHRGSLARYNKNIHGHLHHRQVGEPEYVCVSVECTDYAPIELEDAVRR